MAANTELWKKKKAANDAAKKDKRKKEAAATTAAAHAAKNVQQPRQYSIPENTAVYGTLRDTATVERDKYLPNVNFGSQRSSLGMYEKHLNNAREYAQTREALENTEVQRLLREALGDNYTEQDAVKYMLGAVDDMETMRSTSRDAASARMGYTDVLEGKKGKQRRDLKGLTNLYGYDQTGKELNQRTGAEDYRALAELAKDFNLAEAMMTVEDYYRMLNPSDFSVAYGQAVPTVEQEIFDKAASDIQTFMGINVRDLNPEQVQGVLDEMSANSERTAEYLDYVQNLVKTEDAWKLEQKKQDEYDRRVQSIHTELTLDPNYEFNSQRDMAETDPMYVAVMAEPGSDEQKRAITKLGYDWWARVNGIMPLLGLNAEDSYGFDYMTDDQRKDFSALWRSSDYGGAVQYLKDISWGVNKQKMQDEIQQTRDYAGDGFLKGALASAGSVGRNFMSEIEGMYNAARAAAGIDINEYDVGFMNAVKGQTARQTVGENIAESTKKLNLFGKNIPQMMYNGLMSAADSVLNATTLGGAASPLMGAAAFNSSFQQGLADGKDDKTAFIDAMVDWGIETGTEYFSIEALMDDTSSPLGHFFRNLLTEPAEEMTGFAAGEIYDNLVHGADSRVNNRIAELRTMGYSPADAKAQATREMLADLFETGFSALIAGGVAGGGSAAQMAVTDRKTGSNLESHGDDAVEALLNLADKLDISDEVQQLVKNQRNVLKNRRSNSQTQELTEEDQTETVPDEQEDVVTEEETPVEEPAEEELAPVDTAPAAEKQTEVGASEFKANEIGRIFRETMRVLDDSAKQTVQMVTSRYVAAELRKNGIDDPAITEAVLHIVSDDGKATPEQRQMVTASDGALDVVRRMTERTDNVRELRDRAARIAQKAAKKLKPGEKSEDEAYDEAARKMITEDAAQYTKNTDLIASAYETGQNPETFAEQFRKAFQYGEEGRNLDTIVKSSSFSGITERQVRRAYELGRGERVFRAQEAAKNRKGLVKTGNVDLSEVDKFVKGGGKLNETQRKGIRATSKLAKILGINVKYITNTADESGKITGKNGSWDKETRTLTLDINAGRLSNTDTNYAIMQTLGHELTHFIKDFADAGLFAEYQDFVFSHLSEKVSESALDAKVKEYIARWAEQGQMLDHDGAIEEIVADASGDVLLKLTDADIQELTQKNPTLMQKVGQFIQRWVSDIKMMIADAYRGQTARNAIAEQMLDAADELGARWANLLKNAAENARKSDAVVTSQGAVVSPAEETHAKRAAEKAESAQVQPKNTTNIDGEEIQAEGDKESTNDEKPLAYGHIDMRTEESIRDVDNRLFSEAVEEAQVGYAAAAQMLLADVENSVAGEKFFTDDGVTGQKRMTTSFLGSMKDATGWTWDKIKNSLKQFAAMADGGALPKNTVTNRQMEIYLDDVLSNGYTNIQGQKISPWSEYIEAKNQYKGSKKIAAAQSAYDDAIDFVDYAFADNTEKFSVREVNGKQVVWLDDNILRDKPNDQNYADYVVDYLTEHVGEVYKLIESGQSVYLGKDLPKEYAWSKYSQRIRSRNQQLYKAKARMASGVGEAISIASNRRWEKTKHPENKDARFGIYKYDSKIAFPVVNSAGDMSGVQAYDVTLVIRNASNGTKYLYDIQNIKKDAVTANTLYSKSSGAAMKAAQRESISSAYSIAEGSGKVKASIRENQAATPEFKEWFGDSKIVNPDGTPKVMYHGSPNEFTVFDIKKAKSSGLYGKGFYFTNSASHGGTYGKLYEVYLSIQNPLTPGGSTVTRTQVRKFIEAVAENEDDYSIENYGTYDVNEILRGVYRKDAFAVIQDVNATAIGDMVEAVKLFNNVNGTTFDGIVVDTETVAFEPTQIKSATENIGTFAPDNPDIRYQLRDPDQISDRELLANVMESAAMNEVELDQVKRYRGHIEKLNKYQAELADIAAAIEEGRAEGKPESAFAALRDKARRRQRMIDEEDSWLLKYEAAKPLQAVVQRERENLKRDYDERVEKRVATARNQEAKKREKLRERMDELRTEKNQKIDELRKEKTAKVKEVREEKNESFAKQKYRKMIEDDVGRLRTWVASPTNKDHVPQFLRKPIGDVIAALDFSSDRLLKGGDETNKDKRLGEALDALAVALGRVKEQQASIDSGAQQFASYIDLPEGYQQKFAEMVQKIKRTLDLTKDRGELPINRMTSEQMHELSECLRVLTTSIRQMNRLLANSRFESAISAAGSTIDELGKMASRKDSFKATALLGKFLDWTNTTPIYAFKRFGKGGQAIFEGLMSGWDKLAFNSDALIRFADKAYSKKEVREWSREVRSVKLSSGETVRMTTAQLMSLYCLAKRAQAVGHLLGGGIRIADIDSKGKSIVQSSNYTLSEADLNAFSAELTERQREVADSLQHYMSTQGSKWGNEISMKRFGYEMFTEANYFPIESDSNNLVNVDEKQQENSMFKLLNMSATKGLVKGANNALVVRDIFDVFSAHMSDMAKYNALALPILDALKWLNYVEKRDKDGNPIDPIKLKKGEYDESQFTTRSVQKSLEAAYGKDARQYIVSFIKDLNGDREGGRNDGIINKAISNAKVASVAANLRVYLLQATSLPRAAYSINPKYLSVGLAKMAVNPKKGMELANEKVGIAKWKSMGFYDTNISGNIREMVKHDQSVPDWIREKSMAPAGLMDGLTMGVIYYAAEAECKEKYKQTSVGSEAWDKLVNDRMRDIVYHTQVVDSTMTRSDAMRSKGFITLATSFMSEPTLTMNMIADSIYDMRLKHRGMEDLGHPTARMAKGMAVFTFTAVLAAAAEALFDAIRDDDEYETFSEKYLTALIGDLTDEDTTFQKFTKILFSNVGSNLNMLNSIPIASEVMGLFEGFDNKPMFTAFLDSFKSGFNAYNRWLAGEGTMYSWIYSSLKGVSQVAGLPFSNATRDAVSIWNTFFADRHGKPRIQTYTDSKKQAASAVLDELIAGDTAKADFYRDRAAMHGIGEADIADSLAGLVNDAYVARKIDEKTAERLLTEEAGKRTSQAASMLNKSNYLLETGHKHSEMKDDYISGVISEADARKYLAEYNGMRRDEVDSKIGEWDYEKETGLTYSGMKQDFIDGVLKDYEVIKYRTKYGDATKEEAEETLGHWKYERDTGLAWSELEDDYADGVLSEERVRGYLAKYGGKDEEEVEEKISNYDYHIATGRSTAAPKYWRIAYAFDSGADYQSYIDEAFDTIMYGGEKRKTRKQARSQIASSLASYYKKEYLRVKGTPAGDAMLERILDLYEAIGYSRSYQRDYIAENWVEE